MAARTSNRYQKAYEFGPGSTSPDQHCDRFPGRSDLSAFAGVECPFQTASPSAIGTISLSKKSLERVFKFPKRGSQRHFDRTLAEKNLEELASLAGLAWPCAIGKSNLKTPS